MFSLSDSRHPNSKPFLRDEDTEAHVPDEPARGVEYANTRPHGLPEVIECWPFTGMAR
ncbi:hypothetical protein GALMADRAFT_230631 [Galerina marginata CBS 339.88]|uniref:Uncharacterized protein n=1 Tax=Galerina marginata (strain CBS 339.88) TaxID=685588 RepID=A0A067SNV2_GALM3|nr:hypothetical protein GALMADRAFT_230631 [Galerina marginata CBS 339.88]